MTTILITPPTIPVEVTAEQVVAYLLRPGSGWVEVDPLPDCRMFYADDGGGRITIMNADRVNDPTASLTRTVLAIARAEQRHPSDVLADITGPARGVEGQGCCPDVSTLEATEARFACKVAMGLVKWTSSAPHEAQEESDQ